MRKLCGARLGEAGQFIRRVVVGKKVRFQSKSDGPASKKSLQIPNGHMDN
jgi:hypothetical protein